MSSWPILLAGLSTSVVAWLVLYPLRSSGNAIMASVLVLLLGTLASTLYAFQGRPDAFLGQEDSAPSHASGAEDIASQRVGELVAAAQTQLAAGDTDRATQSLTEAVSLRPDDVTLLTLVATLRAQQDPYRLFDEQSFQWLEHALEIDPGNVRAGWLMGIALVQRGEDARAVDLWEPLLARLDSQTANDLHKQIQLARTRAGMDAAPPLASTEKPSGLTVTVSLSASLAALSRTEPSAMVYIIARAPDGTTMPAAVQKHAAGSLPLDVTLTDADSPMPTRPLSSLREVEVFARWSRTGNANAGKGDVQTTPVRITQPYVSRLSLRIDAEPIP